MCLVQYLNGSNAVLFIDFKGAFGKIARTVVLYELIRKESFFYDKYSFVFKKNEIGYTRHLLWSTYGELELSAPQG